MPTIEKKIKLVSYDQLAGYSHNTCPDNELNIIICLKDNKDSPSFMERANTVVLQFESAEEGYSDNLANLCSTEEIETMLDAVELYEECDTIVVTDDTDLSRAWSVALGLRVYLTNEIRESVTYMVSLWPEVHPNGMWVIDLFDYCLNLKKKLIDRAEEYLATGLVVTKTGIVLKGEWC